MASAWLERAGWRDSGEISLAKLQERFPCPQLCEEGPGERRTVVRGPFFAGLDNRESTLAVLRATASDHEAALRTRADAALEGRFDLLGHRNVFFGSPIDWWRDPLTGIRAPDAHWSRISYLDPTVAGDHKLIFELNRHQFLVSLGQLWWLTGDRRYSDGCARLIEEWMEANPPKQGVNWASSLEISYRSIAWIWTLALLDDALPEGTRLRALGFLRIAGRHLERYLSTYFSPNTHLTGEALGLYYLGVTLPQLPDAVRWRARGERILLEWLPRHARPDGVYVEQSTWYHRYTVEIYTHFLILSEQGGASVRASVGPTLEKMLEHLSAITRPDGSIPLIGDDDGGKLLFLDALPAHDGGALLAVGAALFKRRDFVCSAGALSAEVVWLLGPEGIALIGRLPMRPSAQTSRAFPDGGFYVLRDRSEQGASMMLVDCGPHGFLNGGHAHADALAFDLSVRGSPLFVDPGTYTYTLDAAWRNYFRSSAAHNAVSVDGKSSSEMAGPFQWSTIASAHCTSWLAANRIVFFAGTHDGFERLTPSTTYERAIIFLPPDLWIVRDVVSSAGQHDVCIHLQCAPGIGAHTEHDRTVRLFTQATTLSRIIMHSETGAFEIADGWVSRVYGNRVPAPQLRFVSRSAGRSVYTMVLTTQSSGRLTVRDQPAEGGEAIAVTASSRSGMLWVGDGSEGAAGLLRTDARLAWVEYAADGSPVWVAATGARSLLVSGDPVCSAGRLRPGIVCERGRAGWEATSEVTDDQPERGKLRAADGTDHRPGAGWSGGR